MSWYRLVGAVLYALPVFRDTCMTIIATALPFFPLSVGVPWVSVLGRVVWFLKNTLLFFLPSVCGIFSFKKKGGGGGGWWDGFVCNVKYYAPNLVTGFWLWCFPVILHMYEF